MEDLKELQNICVHIFLIILVCLVFEEFPVGDPAAGSYALCYVVFF